MRIACFALLYIAAATGFRVPTEIGTPSPLSASREAVSVDVAVAAPITQTLEVTSDKRALNLDFVPRFGWRGTVFPTVLSPVLASVLTSVITLICHNEFGFDGIEPQAHQVGGVLVSFLVVFRTQLAYGRYWEGRGHLGVLMAGIVDAASMVSVQFSNAEKPSEVQSARRELGRLLKLYFSETVRFLRATSRDTQRVSNYWLPDEATGALEAAECNVCAYATEAEAEALCATARSPVLVMQWIRAHVYRAGVEQQLVPGTGDADRARAVQLGIDRILSSLQPAFNGCAKIATTPVPQPYTQSLPRMDSNPVFTRHATERQAFDSLVSIVARWLIFWFVYTAPLALLNVFDKGGISFFFVPAGVLLAFGYYGLDYCANQLQNPFIAEFGDVSLDGRFVRAVCTDLDLLLLPPERPLPPERADRD